MKGEGVTQQQKSFVVKVKCDASTHNYESLNLKQPCTFSGKCIQTVNCAERIFRKFFPLRFFFFFPPDTAECTADKTKTHIAL